MKENESLKADNERLRVKSMKDIELFVSEHSDDPIAALQLEIEKLEQKYFAVKEEIKVKNNVIAAQKDLNHRMHVEKQRLLKNAQDIDQERSDGHSSNMATPKSISSK